MSNSINTQVRASNEEIDNFKRWVFCHSHLKGNISDIFSFLLTGNWEKPFHFSNLKTPSNDGFPIVLPKYCWVQILQLLILIFTLSDRVHLVTSMQTERISVLHKIEKGHLSCANVSKCPFLIKTVRSLPAHLAPHLKFIQFIKRLDF